MADKNADRPDDVKQREPDRILLVLLSMKRLFVRL